MSILIFNTGCFWIPFLSAFLIWGALYYLFYYLLTTKEERIADTKRERKERSKRNAEHNRINSTKGIQRQVFNECEDNDNESEETDMDNQYFESNHDSNESNPWNP